MKTIFKVKNFEGHELHCGICGREIKHAYYVEGSKIIMGSECIKKEYGKASLNMIKIADARREKFERDGARLAVELGMNITEVEAGILDGSIC